MASEIIPGVFVASAREARDPDFFRRHNVRRVVNCTRDIPCFFDDILYYRIPVWDAPDSENNQVMAQNLLHAVRFVHDRPPGTAVLIHCAAGVSRSCTVAAAVLRTCCCDSIDKALAWIVDRRPIAFFGGRLVNFQEALYNTFGE